MIDFTIMETKMNVKLATVTIDFFIMLTLTDILSGPDEPAGLQNTLQASASDITVLTLVLWLNFKIK